MKRLLLALAFLASSCWAQDDPHAHHHHTMMPAGEPTLVRSEHTYALPDVQVVRQDGKRLSLAQAVNDGRPVLLNFIYTTCTAICPITSAVVAETRARLGQHADMINMVSISIDPEQDTPKRLAAYAKTYGSAGTWSHFTGTTHDSILIQRAFEAWRGDKMSHQPTTFIRLTAGGPWVRLEGFAKPEDLVAELHMSH
jgi:protein SCO1/2